MLCYLQSGDVSSSDSTWISSGAKYPAVTNPRNHTKGPIHGIPRKQLNTNANPSRADSLLHFMTGDSSASLRGTTSRSAC